jgi:cation:H+ antiporter
MPASATADVTTFVVGAAASLVASTLLASRIERVGGRLRISDALLGLVAALGADSPEITSSVSALRSGQHAIGIGVVLGSNVFNLAALLGLGAVVAGRIDFHRRVVLLEGSVAMAMAGLAVLVVTGLLPPAGALGIGAVVFGAYVALIAMSPSTLARCRLPRAMADWIALAVREEGTEVAAHPRPAVQQPPPAGQRPPRAVARDGGVIAAAIAVVVVASTAMEHAGVRMGDRFHIPTIVTGGIVLAAVTSLPNAVAAVYLARKGRGPAVLSEAMNSNTLNVLVGLLVAGTILGLGTISSGSLQVAWWYAGLSVATLAFAWAFAGVSRRAGLAVIAAYALFVVIVAT